MKRILSVLCLGIATAASAHDVAGTVEAADTAEPLVGAAVYWAETTIGAVTDLDGAFSLDRPRRADRLVATFVGYRPDTVFFQKNQKITFKLQPLQMDEVDVSARRIGATVSRLDPLNTTRITKAELCKAACCNLGESFETNASVDVSYTDATTGAKTIQLLGLSGRYVQMLTENVPNMRGLAQAYGLSYVPGPWMDGIQVSKGVGTVVNGTEAFTGQINLEYIKPVGEEDFVLDIFGSSSGTFDINVVDNIHLGEDLSTTYMVNGMLDIGGDGNGDGFHDTPKTNQINILNRYYYNGDNGYNWQLVAKYTREERIGGSIDFSGKEPSKDFYGVRVETNRVETWMKNGFSFSENTSLGIVTSYIWHRQNSFFGQKTYNGTQHSYTANAIFQTGNETHTLHAGLSSQGDFYREDIGLLVSNADIDKLYGVNLSAVPNASLLNEKYNDIATGAFVQYTLTVPETLTVIAGLRGDINNHFGFIVTPRLHVKYTPTEHTHLRLGAGRGVRTAALFAENNSLLASSRKWIFDERFVQEDGWNYGLSLTQYIHIADRELSLSAEYYRTQFTNQLMVDISDTEHFVYFAAAKNAAYSNTFQVEAKLQPINGLELNAAVRFTDSQQKEHDGVYRRRPLLSKYKGMLSASYATPRSGWQFDFTAQLNGGGRVAVVNTAPAEYQRPSTFDAYQVYNAQISKKFGGVNVYVGAENIGNFTQENPIIAANDPYGKYFDSTQIWGPLTGREFYLGLSWTMERECEHEHHH